MEIAKELEWLRPFVESVHGIVPVRSVIRIVGYKVPLSKEEQVSGMCSRFDDGSGYAISLLTHVRYTHPKRKRGPGKPKHYYEKMESGQLLETLAHELAHVGGLEHDRGHWDRMSQIMVRFGETLGKLNLNELEGTIE